MSPATVCVKPATLCVQVSAGQRLACFQPRHIAATTAATAVNAATAATADPSPSSAATAAASLDAPPRTDLARVLARRAATEDEPRAATDARYAERRTARHAAGRRTAREQVGSFPGRPLLCTQPATPMHPAYNPAHPACNPTSQVAALVDSCSFREYGRHAIAAQLGRNVVSSE